MIKWLLLPLMLEPNKSATNKMPIISDLICPIRFNFNFNLIRVYKLNNMKHNNQFIIIGPLRWLHSGDGMDGWWGCVEVSVPVFPLSSLD